MAASDNSVFEALREVLRFREADSALFAELGDVTEAAIAGLRRAGFISP